MVTEAERIFYDDVREKKIISRSASKTNRKGKGPVRFPSDYLTKKEREKMNGECRVLKKGYFYSWEEFKALPKEWQVEWTNDIIERYGLAMSGISDVIFGQCTRLETYMRHHEIADKISRPGRGGRKAVENKYRLRLAFEKQKKIEDIPRIELQYETPTEEVKPYIDIPEMPMVKTAFFMKSATLEFDGANDKLISEELLDILKHFDPNRVHITVTINEKGE